jgi:histidine phosphotransferase ChpT
LALLRGARTKTRPAHGKTEIKTEIKSMMLDIRVLELLASKICHDLISPVSAINNGVELIEDIGGDVMDEAMKLIGSSASHASRRLKLFRLAYGRAGSEANLPVRDVRQTIEQYLQNGKIALNWPESVVLDRLAAQRGGLKTLANLVIMGEEILAYGGSLTVRDVPEGNTAACVLEVVGRNAQLSEAFSGALTGVTLIEDLSPRTIQAYVTGRFAESFGLGVTSSLPDPDHLDLSLSVLSL